MNNKKATIGATLTWVVATIIIFVVIIIFVLLSSGGLLKSDSFEQGRLSTVDSEQMLLALMKTEVDGKMVKDWILETDKEDKNVLWDKLRPLLNKLSTPTLYGGWGIKVDFPDDDYDFEVMALHLSPPGTLTDFQNRFRISTLNLEDKKVSFFLSCSAKAGIAEVCR